ncbi:hypothetical protein [Photorhabdus luminescens]|uniref:hypothetical protein n=1 Tax=Photorhabdus luminescens TaxID=29488 RepID=UPI00223E90AF|nr:hypothetical protein [Photorhabdus luminescens]MCW7763379.1 hypothetical protein [Photorhabdus luminescens subsp. venezuelensis]
MNAKNKELFANFCKLAKANLDESTTETLCKTADYVEEMQEQLITIEEQFSTMISKYYALIEFGEASGYFSFSPKAGFNTYTSYTNALAAAYKDINTYKNCADVDNCKDINKICCGVITKKAIITDSESDYTLQGINPDEIIRKIQSDAEDKLVEKIGDMYDVATSFNEKDTIGQTYCLLKYGILPSLRDVTKQDIISKSDKSMVAKLAYIIGKKTNKSIIGKILQTTSISKKSLAGAPEYYVAKIRKHCSKQYWNAPMGIGADYKGLHIETIGGEIFIKDSQGRFYIEVPSYIDITRAEQVLNEWLLQIEA